MRLITLIVLFISSIAYGFNSPVIWHEQNTAKFLTDKTEFKNNVMELSGDLDPSSVAVDAPAGSVYYSTSGSQYIKQDAGLTTNWLAIVTGSAGVPSFDLTKITLTRAGDLAHDPAFEPQYFTTIQAALDAIPYPTTIAEATYKWTIFIPSGFYDEELYIKAGLYLNMIAVGPVMIGSHYYLTTPNYYSAVQCASFPDITIELDATKNLGADMFPTYNFTSIGNGDASAIYSANGGAFYHCGKISFDQKNPTQWVDLILNLNNFRSRVNVDAGDTETYKHATPIASFLNGRLWFFAKEYATDSNSVFGDSAENANLVFDMQHCENCNFEGSVYVDTYCRLENVEIGKNFPESIADMKIVNNGNGFPSTATRLSEPCGLYNVQFRSGATWIGKAGTFHPDIATDYWAQARGLAFSGGETFANRTPIFNFATASIDGILKASDFTTFNSKLTSPMTTEGDIIVQGAASAERLGVGSENQVLKVVAGVPAWAADAEGTGTVTQVDVGDGLTGGPITTSGTLDLVLDGGTLSKSASGLKVADDGISGAQLNAGIETDGHVLTSDGVGGIAWESLIVPPSFDITRITLTRGGDKDHDGTPDYTPTYYDTIQAALDAIPYPTDKITEAYKWQIFIPAGYYDEELRIKAGLQLAMIAVGTVTIGTHYVQDWNPPYEDWFPNYYGALQCGTFPDITIEVDSRKQFAGDTRPTYVFTAWNDGVAYTKHATNQSGFIHCGKISFDQVWAGPTPLPWQDVTLMLSSFRSRVNVDVNDTETYMGGTPIAGFFNGILHFYAKDYATDSNSAFGRPDKTGAWFYMQLCENCHFEGGPVISHYCHLQDVEIGDYNDVEDFEVTTGVLSGASAGSEPCGLFNVQLQSGASFIGPAGTFRPDVATDYWAQVRGITFAGGSTYANRVPIYNFATASVDGILKASDFTTFNNKLTSPMTTQGDVIVQGAASAERLAVGSEGQVLKVVAGVPAWAADASGSGTVTEVATGSGLTGGPITTSGTISVNEGAVDHNNLLNTHNLTTDIDHDQLTNTHNLTTDIDHDQLTNFSADEHYTINDVGTGLTDLWSASKINTELGTKEPTLTKGDLTESTSSILTITGGTGAVIGAGTSIQVQQASTSTDGYLSSTDWNTFNSKSDTVGTVTQVDTGSGLTGGPITATGTISVPTDGITATHLANVASLDSNVALGTGASAGSGIAIGNTATQSGGANGIAIGTNSAATGASAIAVGNTANAAFARSVALGHTVTTTATDEFRLGNVNHHFVFTGASSIQTGLGAINGKAFYDDGVLLTGNLGTVTSVTAGTGLSGGTITDSGTISVNEGAVDHNNLLNTHNLTTDIDHDQLTNFSADEHYTINDVGTGLTDLWSASKINTELGTKEPTLTKGDLTESTSSVLTITGGTGAVIGAGTSIQVAQASTSTDGYLSSTDWNTFNNKSDTVGTVTSVAVGDGLTGGPITSTGTIDLTLDGTTLAKSASGLKVDTDGITANELLNVATLDTALAIGTGANADGNAIALGNLSNALAAGSSIAIGNGAIVGGSNNSPIAIGNGANGGTWGSVAIGEAANGSGTWGIAIGHEADTNSYSVVIGGNSIAGGGNAVALGYTANAGAGSSTAIGSQSNTATFNNSVALGYQATVTANNQVMLGTASETVKVPGILQLASGSTTVNEISTDDTLSGDSDAALVTEQSIKAYVDGQVSAVRTYTRLEPASVTVTTGSSASVVADAQDPHDGNVYDLDEAASTPGFDFYFEFTSVTDFSKVWLLAWYEGVSTHYTHIDVYNWNSTSWNTYRAMPTGNGMDGFEFTIPDRTNYIGTGGDAGKVRVRFYHSSAGNASHNIHVDAVNLLQ